MPLKQSLKTSKITILSLALAALLLFISLNEAVADGDEEQDIVTSTEAILEKYELTEYEEYRLAQHDKAAIASMQDVPVVGVFVARGNDFEETEADMVDLMHWLLGNAGIDEGSVVTSGQTKAQDTMFTVFVGGEAKLYSFGTIERGITTSAVEDLEKEKQIKSFEQKNGL